MHPRAAEPDLRLRTFWGRWWNELVQLDAPTWRTLRRLLVSPGRLAEEHFDPQGGGHVHPIRLYLTINILFFFIAPWVNLSESGFQLTVWHVEHRAAVAVMPPLGGALDAQIERSGIDEDLYKAVLDSRMQAQQGTLVWILIPFVALASFAVARRHRPYLVEHLVLATLLVSFFLATLLLVSIPARIFVEIGGMTGKVIAVVVLLAWALWLPTVLYRSLRVFFDAGRFVAVLMSIWLSVALQVGVIVYIVFLCVGTMIGLRGLQSPG